MGLEWDKLLNSSRRRPPSKKSGVEVRTQFERDFDRVLFSTPVRRLADKTQVFPLERNDSVRTRLTHSHEVSNLARSIGTHLVFTDGLVPSFAGVENVKRDVPALLATLGLVHDIGNPPFGHQGEHAIRRWFANAHLSTYGGIEGLSEDLQADFLTFEGNAQTLRLVARLQMRNDDTGLNLTYGTLAALLKYTVRAHEADPEATYAGAKKPGYFASEESIVDQIRAETGLASAVRHPLTYIVEACDDIAYSVIDAEDTVKKGIASYPDLRDFMSDDGADLKHPKPDSVVTEVIKSTDADRRELRDGAGGLALSPAEYNDHSMQLFRSHAIAAMLRAVTTAFVENLPKMIDGSFSGDLMKASSAATFARRLKAFDRAVAYRHRSVLAVELHGYRVITGLMNAFWRAICDRSDRDGGVTGSRVNPASAYVYGLISENYRRIFEAKESALPIRYREAQLLCDMIAGMTDSFAVSLYDDLHARGLISETHAAD